MGGVDGINSRKQPISERPQATLPIDSTHGGFLFALVGFFFFFFSIPSICFLCCYYCFVTGGSLSDISFYLFDMFWGSFRGHEGNLFLTGNRDARGKTFTYTHTHLTHALLWGVSKGSRGNKVWGFSPARHDEALITRQGG